MQKTALIDIELLKENPDNPRTITEAKFSQLVASIKQFPEMLQVRPIAFKSGYIVLGGNMRLRACKEAGLKKVPAIDLSGLTPEQQREFVIKDNVGFGEWDWQAIQADWPEAEEWGLDIPDAFKVVPEAVEDDYEIPDEVHTDIVLGDLFEIGEHRLLCGDSTNSDVVGRLMDGQKADITFTSPPYNGNTTMYDFIIVDGKKKRNDKTLYTNNDTDNKTSDEYIEFNHIVLNICFINTKGYIFWNINYNAKSRFEYLEAIYPYRKNLQETIIWKKNALPTANGFTRNFEFIFLFKTNAEIKHLNKEYDVVHNVWEVNNSGSQKENHKACFPVGLPAKAIGISEMVKIVFDPFLGSGTTMVASHQLNRKCYGMELDPKYCQVIIDRMRKLDPALTILKNGLPLTYDD